jgi:hypothetical protein
MRSKFYIPCIAGGRPPDFRILDHLKDSVDGVVIPFSREEVTSLNRSALFYLTILSPWTLQANPAKREKGELLPSDGTKFDDFVSFMEHLDGKFDDTGEAADGTRNSSRPLFEQPSALQRSMKTYIQNLATNLRTTEEAKKMGIAWKNRASKRWPMGRPKRNFGVPADPSEVRPCDLRPYAASQVWKASGAGSAPGGQQSSDDGLNYGCFRPDNDDDATDKALQQLQNMTKMASSTAAGSRALSNATTQQNYIDQALSNFRRLLPVNPLKFTIRNAGVQSIMYALKRGEVLTSPIQKCADIFKELDNRNVVPSIVSPVPATTRVALFSNDITTGLASATTAQRQIPSDHQQPLQIPAPLFTLEHFLSSESRPPSPDQLKVISDMYAHVCAMSEYKRRCAVFEAEIGRSLNMDLDAEVLSPNRAPSVTNTASRLNNRQRPQPPPQLRLLLLGGPGTGKTWTVNKLIEIIEAFGLKAVCMAYTGKAASLMSGGNHIC